MAEHSMKLYDEPFEGIQSGRKTVEVRCNDEKRQKIQVGDTIVFSRYDDPADKLTTKVVELRSFDTFEELYCSFPMEVFGVSDQTVESMVQGVGEIYSQEQQTHWGALAITLELLPELPKIIPLRGPDRIRKRPAVIFGSADLEGAKQAVSDLLHIFATEAQLGHCSHLPVVQNGADLIISAADRGLYLGQDTDDDTAWEKIFGDFYCQPACPPNEEGYSFGLFDDSHHILYGDSPEIYTTLMPEDGGCFELYCAVSVCKVMDVVSVRNGVRGDLHFEGGHNLGGLKKEKTDEYGSNHTVLHFELDEDVFTDTMIPAEFFLEKLERFAMLCPGVNCTYVDTVTGWSDSFCYPKGIVDYVQSKSNMDVYYKKIQGKGKERYNRGEYEACVEVALVPAMHNGSVLCLHNFRQLTYGGTHYSRMEKRVSDAFSSVFGESLTFEELSKHLAVVLASWCTPRCTAWTNGARLAIENRVIADMTEDALAMELGNYVYRNKEVLRSVVNTILKERKSSL